MIRILFICHGNICRSTMAQFVMQDLVNKASRASEFTIDSAATRTDEIGSGPHGGTVAICKAKGVPVLAHKARQITRADYNAWDYIIYMDAENKRDLERILGTDSEGKVSRLLDWTDHPRDVADPWYTGDFVATYNDVLAGCAALLDSLS